MDWFIQFTDSFLHCKDHESQLHFDDIIVFFGFLYNPSQRSTTYLKQPILTNHKKKPFVCLFRFFKISISTKLLLKEYLMAEAVFPSSFPLTTNVFYLGLLLINLGWHFAALDTMWSKSIPNVIDVREIGGVKKQKQGGTFEISENIFKGMFGSCVQLKKTWSLTGQTFWLSHCNQKSEWWLSGANRR